MFGLTPEGDNLENARGMLGYFGPPWARKARKKQSNQDKYEKTKMR